MASNHIIDVNLFGQEIGKIGLHEDQRRSSFQYNPEYLASNSLQHIFPKTGILKWTRHVQLFSQFDNETFRGIPPQFADSLPDMFGSIIFKAWLDSKEHNNISVLEQLAYVGNRGMGAIEYSPSIPIKATTSIDLNEIIEVLKEVLNLKKSTAQKNLDSKALINIFKIGTSAGGARPKILISEEKETGKVIPGDVVVSDKYNHYLVKLAIDEEVNYPREVVEYCYYQILKKIGIRMMDSKLIDDRHFATLRFDRQDGEKQHVLTASGMTGWDYRSPNKSSYENLFKLCSFLKIPHSQIEELFKRMIFNVMYGNTDDHLKNHSFIYSQQDETWELSPAYDITYALNPLIDFNRTKRALSINGKRSDITLKDVYKLADDFTIKNPGGIISNILSYKDELSELFKQCNLPKLVSERITKSITGLKSST
jgi:serine/threonine-protein kinase HipA